MRAWQMLQNSNMCKGNFLKPDESFLFYSLRTNFEGIEFIKVNLQIVLF